MKDNEKLIKWVDTLSQMIDTLVKDLMATSSEEELLYKYNKFVEKQLNQTFLQDWYNCTHNRWIAIHLTLFNRPEPVSHLKGKFWENKKAIEIGKKYREEEYALFRLVLENKTKKNIYILKEGEIDEWIKFDKVNNILILNKKKISKEGGNIIKWTDGKKKNNYALFDKWFNGENINSIKNIIKNEINNFKNKQNNWINIYDTISNFFHGSEILRVNKEEEKVIVAVSFIFLISIWPWKYLYFFPIRNFRPLNAGCSLSTDIELCEDQKVKIWNAFQGLLFPVVMRELELTIQKHALRSAVAAIMARNRAHIFDSQVLVRFKNLKEGDFSKLKDYIITRSEYIADVTGEIPILWGEGYLERKVGETSVSGIIQEFRDVEVHTKLAEASSGKIPLIDIVVDGLDQRIGFPFGASVGRHAINGILENYIRNVSKYGFINSNNKELIITLQKNKKNSEKDGYIWVKLSSNSKIATNKASYKNRAEEIAKYVKSPVVGPTGERLRKGWGLSEMKIHACFLAGENINLLLKEGTLPFFEFDENAAKKSGDYVFRFKVRRYEPYLYLKTKEKAGQFISEPMSFPLCDFVVLGPNVSQFYDRNNWHVFPTRVGIVGKNKSKQNLLDKRMIYIDQDKNLETKLWEKFWELLKKHGAVEYEVKILDNTYNVEFGNGKKLALYHDEDYLRRQAENFAQKTIIRFSHQKLMNIWLDELKKAKGKTIPKLKWLVLLGAKVLLVDTRLYEQWESLDEVTKNELAILGVHVVPESCKFRMKNKTIICNWKNQKRTQELNLSSLQFISVHLGYLEENPNSALLKENNLTMLPPFIFMHTMRGKIDKEFIKKNWWFKKIISVGSLLSAFNENYGLEIKMRLMGLMLSPQQAKEV